MSAAMAMDFLMLLRQCLSVEDLYHFLHTLRRYCGGLAAREKEENFSVGNKGQSAGRSVVWLANWGNWSPTQVCLPWSPPSPSRWWWWLQSLLSLCAVRCERILSVRVALYVGIECLLVAFLLLLLLSFMLLYVQRILKLQPLADSMNDSVKGEANQIWPSSSSSSSFVVCLYVCVMCGKNSDTGFHTFVDIFSYMYDSMKLFARTQRLCDIRMGGMET